jgi:SAM-dependent methyltransferase
MAGVEVFERELDRYEAWFDEHRNAHAAEVRAVKELVPAAGRSVEIGVGTGRFARPLGVRLGVDPCLAMLRLARDRGVEVLMGVGEALPLPDACFDVALMVTTICFLDDIDRAFHEVRRILRPKGCIVVGLVDRDSPLGRAYLERRGESVFYSLAEFYSVEEIMRLLSRVGFRGFEYRQTLFGPPAETPASEPVKSGFGEGSFAAVRASIPAR